MEDAGREQNPYTKVFVRIAWNVDQILARRKPTMQK
jgi:hypothetical protein